jgi:hypothetical protein
LAPGTETVGAALLGVGHDQAEAVIVVESLEDQIPQRDERRKGPLIKD